MSEINLTIQVKAHEPNGQNNQSFTIETENNVQVGELIDYLIQQKKVSIPKNQIVAYSGSNLISHKLILSDIQKQGKAQIEFRHQSLIQPADKQKIAVNQDEKNNIQQSAEITVPSLEFEGHQNNYIQSSQPVVFLPKKNQNSGLSKSGKIKLIVEKICKDKPSNTDKKEQQKNKEVIASIRLVDATQNIKFEVKCNQYMNFDQLENIIKSQIIKCKYLRNFDAQLQTFKVFFNNQSFSKRNKAFISMNMIKDNKIQFKLQRTFPGGF